VTYLLQNLHDCIFIQQGEKSALPVVLRRPEDAALNLSLLIVCRTWSQNAAAQR